MLIKPTKKWKYPNGLDDIMIPYTYYRLVESYRDADGRTKQRTVVEETFKTLKTDLDIRPVFHKSDDGTKAHLHLAILAYWVVSTAKYILKQKGINVRWSEILRITSAQQRVTMAGNTIDGKNVRIRKSTEPEEKLASIQSALGTPLELGS